jgi:hypothetical protein
MTLPVVFTANGPSGYNLTNSLRFRQSASAYLNRTPTVTSNRRTWTWSGWVKLGEIGRWEGIFNAGSSGNQFAMYLYTDSTLYIQDYTGSNNIYLQTTQVFRDPSAWYHIVFAVDTTQATSTDRFKLYINGTQVTSFVSTTYPSQNYDTQVNSTSYQNNLGLNYQFGTGNAKYFDGYMDEINFIDGQALTPSSFGETSTTTGVWQPKKYTGTYGTNGFYLPFTDNSALTTSSNVGLGKDFSGNANYWTTNNISITSGTTYDSMTDVPTLTSATTANYCVLSPLDYYSPYLNAPTEGNLKQSNTTGSAWGINRSTIGITSGKWYVEVTQTGSNLFAGVVSGSTSLTFPLFTGSSGLYAFFNNGAGTTGYPYANGTSGTVFTIASGDVIGLAYDYDAQTLAIYRNNSLEATVTSIPKTDPMFFCAAFAQTTATTSWNFGQRPFAYTPPTGFNRLNTFNLPTPTIGATASSQANKYMNIALYTGTGSSQSITGVGFQPDWTWIKGRSGATDHGLYDAVRGVQKQLESNNTDAETTETTGLTAFGSDGFTVGALAQLNTSSATYVGWNWKANGAGSTNTAGSITSTVSANTTAGFSVVTYTGNGSNSTVGHGLGVAPSMVIVKCRSTAGESWHTYHVGLSSPANTVYLNGTAAQSSFPTCFNSMSTLNSTLFSLGTDGASNGSGRTYVSYVFAPIAGYSAFGSYTGNGSSDGTFVYTGFKPRFIMTKNASASGSNWSIQDTSRSTYNVTDSRLFPNDSSAEISNGDGLVDINSNGFKIRTSHFGMNGSGNTIIYMAFCESPFKYANAR